jgi:hypothetical protein
MCNREQYILHFCPVFTPVEEPFAIFCFSGYRKQPPPSGNNCKEFTLHKMIDACDGVGSGLVKADYFCGIISPG